MYHVSLETPKALQMSEILLPERSGSTIILYLFSIVSICCYTPRHMSVNDVRKLKCQLCVEVQHLVIGVYEYSDAIPAPMEKEAMEKLILLKF
ncbi:hypothetical protein BH23THE1_BH23THE1_32010 [soil metagenome]